MKQDDGSRTLGAVDTVSVDDLHRLADVEPPCVTISLPTTPFGPGTRSGSSRLHHLANQVATVLTAEGRRQAEAEELLGPVRRLEEDDEFWQHLSEGLALFVAPGFFEGFRVPGFVPEQAVVGDAFRVLPLVPHVGADTTFHILALARNSVRVLRAGAHTVGELDLPGLPKSMEQAVPEAEPDRVRGVHSVGAAGAITHGQGTESEYDKKALERYFRAVDDALLAGLPDRPGPLVLASVGNYLPTYQSVSRHPLVWDRAVEGNPEHRSAQELHDAAWPLVAEHFRSDEVAVLGRYREAAGKGRTLTGADQVLAAALEGRVETVLVDAQAATSGDAVLDRAVLETVRRSGGVVAVAADDDLADTAAAILRY